MRSCINLEIFEKNTSIFYLTLITLGCGESGHTQLLRILLCLKHCSLYSICG